VGTGDDTGAGTDAAGVSTPDGASDGLRDDGGATGLAVRDLRVSDDTVAPPTPPALGPGDDDPLSPAKGQAEHAKPALGPGDDDPASPNPHEGYRFLTPPPAGPGGTDYGARHLVRIPKE
jgi:hypothetical protein